MKVLITGSISPISIANMWYFDRIGETFEVKEDPFRTDVYETVDPIFKEHIGHIYKTDCIEVWDKSPSEAAADE